MTGIARIELGATVPIALQLVDGVTNQYPRAEVRDDAGNLLTTLDLSHEASGLYVPGSPYAMPAEIFIKVTYIVYSDAGHTTESTTYLRDIDVWETVNPTLYKADVSTLAIESNVAGHVQTAMTAQGYSTARATLLDNLDAAVSTIVTAIGNLNNLSDADVQTAMTAQGYTTDRAALLDNLDAALTGVAGAILTAIGNLNNVSITDVQSAMTAQGYTAARALLLDNLTQLLVATEKIRKVTTNKVVVNLTDTQIDVYEDNQSAIAFSFSLSTDRRTRMPL